MAPNATPSAPAPGAAKTSKGHSTATAPADKDSLILSRPAVAPAATSKPIAGKADSLFSARVHATRAWLRESPPDTYTLQLLTAEAARESEIDAWLRHLPAEMPHDKLYIYNTTNRDKRRVGVLFGSYPDRQTALEAQAKLPRKLLDSKPLIRTVAGLRAEVGTAP